MAGLGPKKGVFGDLFFRLEAKCDGHVTNIFGYKMADISLHIKPSMLYEARYNKHGTTACCIHYSTLALPALTTICTHVCFILKYTPRFPNFHVFFSIFSEREEENILLYVGKYREENTRIRTSWGMSVPICVFVDITT